MHEDVPAIVTLLADDSLGARREGDPSSPAYTSAYADIAADPRQLLTVGTLDGEIVATMQLTIIPGLSRLGSKRLLIEAVRVRGDRRGRGLGRQLITWAIDEARARGCAVVQLTSDKSRTDAHRFYESLGFEGGHVGMKLVL
jgi:GNAT superfamily N-acetyltransferase